MARTLVIGLTESGTRTTVNEDTFSLGGRVYPDMITGSEERSGKSSAYTQLYAVTHGYGGPGAGDLAGRIIQRTVMDLSEMLAQYKRPELDFRSFCKDLITEAHARVIRQIKPRNNGGMTGASLALLLIDANVAYILNIGDTDIHLFRNDKLMHPTLAACEGEDPGAGRTWVIGEGERPPGSFPLTIKQFSLRPGDIILLSSLGFNQGYGGPRLAEDLASPDAFAATIRQAQIHSRQRDDSVDGTILAVKIRDLELREPDGDIPESEVRRAIYHNGQGLFPDEETDDLPAAYKPKKEKAANKGEESMARTAKKERRKRNLKTFFLFLLLGFLIGMAVILLVWFLILS